MSGLSGQKAACFLVLVISLVPARAGAQTGGLADLLPNILLGDLVVPSTTPVTHDAHFTPLNPLFEGRADAEAARRIAAVGTVYAFNRALATQFATFPLGSSSGGFTYKFDSSLGTFSRSTQSFGPAFAERPSTIGRGKMSLGFNYQHAGYDTFEGKDLNDGSIKFYIPHNDCCLGQTVSGQAVGDGDPTFPGFEGDVMQAALALDARSDTVAIFGNFGVTNQWDIGVAIPIVRVSLDATVVATIERLATAGTTIHSFSATQDVTQATFSDSASATGIGDIVLRSKYSFINSGSNGIAAAIDVRLPTGDENDLLGTGAAQAKVYLVASAGGDRLAEHFNIGYTFSSSKELAPGATGALAGLLASELPDEVNYVAGIDLAASPKFTIMADIIGRTLRDAGRLEDVSKTFKYRIQGEAATAPLRSTSFNEFAVLPGDLNLVLGTAGFKFNPSGNLLISASVLFPLTDAGLRDRFTPVFGIDYAF